MTKLETTFGQTYKVQETPEQIAEQANNCDVLHLTRPNGQTISINKLHCKSWEQRN